VRISAGAVALLAELSSLFGISRNGVVDLAIRRLARAEGLADRSDVTFRATATKKGRGPTLRTPRPRCIE
jgi:hypothetical protein